MVNTNEIKCIRYYIGDTDSADKFWGDPKAYLVLNSLFYPDILSESARASEGKYLNPEILADTERLAWVYRNLFSAFSKCAAECDLSAYRVERYSDYLESLKYGKTISFTSTSDREFLGSYLNRSGVALMRFTIRQGTPCLNMAEILENYSKSEEAEILLPPEIMLDIQEIPLTDDESRMRDSAGNPPIVSCRVETMGIIETAFDGDTVENGNIAGMKVLENLNNGIKPDVNDIELYSEWKTAFISVLLSEFRQKIKMDTF